MVNLPGMKTDSFGERGKPMKCKYCQAELEEGATLCPACGKEQEEAAEPKAAATEPLPRTFKEKIKWLFKN